MFLNQQIYSLKFKLKSTSNGPNFYFELFEDRTKSELKITRIDWTIIIKDILIIVEVTLLLPVTIYRHKPL